LLRRISHNGEARGVKARILRYQEFPVVPWKNGLGVSRPIAAVPPADEGFGWRLSMADITTDAVFSEYPGIDRTLAVVEGEIELRIEDAARHLRAGDPAVAFSGDVPASAKPIVGAAVDLNLMIARDTEYEGRIEPLQAGRYVVETAAVIVSLVPGLRVRAGAQYPLGRLDALFVEGSTALDLRGDADQVIAYGVFIR
jgi:uncharacterized protein